MSENQASVDQPIGIAAAFAAYGMWGFLPLYFDIAKFLSPFEIIMHRVIWGMAFCAIIIYWRHQYYALVAIYTSEISIGRRIKSGGIADN